VSGVCTIVIPSTSIVCIMFIKFAGTPSRFSAIRITVLLTISKVRLTSQEHNSADTPHSWAFSSWLRRSRKPLSVPRPTLLVGSLERRDALPLGVTSTFVPLFGIKRQSVCVSELSLDNKMDNKNELN
jgi:hypothetical protein